jgi:hypothetical protein
VSAPDIRAAILGALVGRPSAAWSDLPPGAIPRLAERMAPVWGVQPSSADKTLRRYLRDRQNWQSVADLESLLGVLGLVVGPAEKSTAPVVE